MNLSTFGALKAVSGSGTITGGSVTLVAGAGIGTASRRHQARRRPGECDAVNVNAKGGSVYLEQTAGDLRLFALTATGDAFVTVDAGNLVNVNTNVVQDDRTVDQLRAGAWSELALTGTAAQAKIQTTLTEYQLYQEQQYKTYWKYAGQLVGGEVMLSSAEVTYYSGIYGAQADAQGLTGQAKADFVTNAISTLELSETQQYFNLQAKFGVGGTYAAFIASGASKYDPTLGIDVTGAAYDPTTYNPNFTYLLTDNTNPANLGERQTLSAGIKVWTEDELINAIGAGLLKTVTSTEVNTVVNITAQKITLNVGGNVGTIDNPVTDLVGFSTAVKPVIVDSATQLALGAAERSDLNFLTVAPVTATVNFIVDSSGVGSMVRTDGGVWNPSIFKVGQAVYIGGNSGNATEGGVYQTIASITAATATQGATITFVKGAAPAIQTEFGRTILTAPVVTNLDTVDNSTHTTPLATAVSFGNINNNGTITLASGTWDTNLYKAGRWHLHRQRRNAGRSQRQCAGQLLHHRVGLGRGHHPQMGPGAHAGRRCERIR